LRHRDNLVRNVETGLFNTIVEVLELSTWPIELCINPRVRSYPSRCADKGTSPPLPKRTKISDRTACPFVWIRQTTALRLHFECRKTTE